MQAIVDSDTSETLKFWWKVSSNLNDDYLEFYIDGQLQSGRISGEVDWTQKTYNVSAGIHTFKWRYIRYSLPDDADGEDRGWVDYVEWSGSAGSPPPPDPNNSWGQIDYKYDVYGRRIEKDVDGYTTKYIGACGEQRRIQRRPGDIN
ncbi:MAG: hypothetical protein ACYSWW_08875 [Planctomycetota bacterium]|jgi:hypothetical protein